MISLILISFSVTERYSESGFVVTIDMFIKGGFTEEDLYYEYEYAWDNGTVFRLSLYCDEYVTRGTGLIRRYWEGEYVDLEIFSFDGCEQYLDDAAVGQYSVYSDYYTDGREIHFLEGETIDDYFSSVRTGDENWYVFKI